MECVYVCVVCVRFVWCVGGAGCEVCVVCRGCRGEVVAVYVVVDLGLGGGGGQLGMQWARGGVLGPANVKERGGERGLCSDNGAALDRSPTGLRCRPSRVLNAASCGTPAPHPPHNPAVAPVCLRP